MTELFRCFFFSFLFSAFLALRYRGKNLIRDGLVTHTQLRFKPWWRLDLLNVYKVSYIRITNRGDCCAKRLNGAEIRIGNSLRDHGNLNPRYINTL